MKLKMSTFDWVYLVFALLFLGREARQQHPDFVVDLVILAVVYLAIHFALEFDKKRKAKRRGIDTTRP